MEETLAQDKPARLCPYGCIDTRFIHSLYDVTSEERKSTAEEARKASIIYCIHRDNYICRHDVEG